MVDLVVVNRSTLELSRGDFLRLSMVVGISRDLIPAKWLFPKGTNRARIILLTIFFKSIVVNKFSRNNENV